LLFFLLLLQTGGRIRLLKKSVKHRAHRHWGATPVELKGGKGITRNFSSTGIFFETDKSFAQGQPIDFTIVLENVDPVRPVRVKCRGEIVRVEESGQKIGVAVSISSYNFERLRAA
jgi:PilZ domain